MKLPCFLIWIVAAAPAATGQTRPQSLPTDGAQAVERMRRQFPPEVLPPQKTPFKLTFQRAAPARPSWMHLQTPATEKPDPFRNLRFLPRPLPPETGKKQ